MEIKEKIKNFTDLEAWKTGHTLVLLIYKITRKFPKEEQFGIVNQMRRAGVSITSNIAEGFSRSSPKEKAQFYSIACGSVTELQNQIMISRDVGYLDIEEYKQIEIQTVKTHKLVNGLIKYIKTLFIFLPFILATLSFIPSPASAALIKRPPNNLGLVGYWSFNEGKGDIAGDFSGKGNTGVLTNSSPSTAWVNGKQGKAINFDGTDDYVQIPHNANQLLTNGGSISAWIFPRTVGGGGAGRILDKGESNAAANGFQFYMSTGGINSVSFRINGGTVVPAGTNAITFDAWNHVVVTFTSDGTTTFYINGVQSGTPAQTTAPSAITTTNPLAIGNRSNATDRAFDGIIDEERMYDRVLSASDAEKIYKSGLQRLNISSINKNMNGLVGYWTFDGVDMVSATATDRSGQGNNGAVNGPVKTIGKLGQALNFDGSNDVVNVGQPSVLNNLGPVTYSLWVKPNLSAIDVEYFLLGKASGALPAGLFFFEIYNYAGGERSLYFQKNGTGGSSVSRQTNNNLIKPRIWQHVVVTWDGSTTSSNVHIYYNGEEATYQGGGNATALDPDPSISFTIGARADNSNSMDGAIDEVRVYNRVLPLEEIKGLYNAGSEKLQTSQTNKLTNSLVGFWSFNGADMTTATATDRSGQGSNGALIGGPMKVAGKVGQALNFDGTNDYIEIADNDILEGGTTKTISVWVKPTSVASIMMIFEKGDTNRALPEKGPYFLAVCNDGRVVVHATQTNGNTNEFMGSTTLSTNTWYHLALIINTGEALGADEVKLYINGTKESRGSGDCATDNQTDLGAIQSNGQPLFVGIRDNNGTKSLPFQGIIDEARVYSRALSADEVKYLYNLGR